MKSSTGIYVKTQAAQRCTRETGQVAKHSAYLLPEHRRGSTTSKGDTLVLCGYDADFRVIVSASLARIEKYCCRDCLPAVIKKLCSRTSTDRVMVEVVTKHDG